MSHDVRSLAIEYFTNKEHRVNDMAWGGWRRGNRLRYGVEISMATKYK